MNTSFPPPKAPEQHPLAAPALDMKRRLEHHQQHLDEVYRHLALDPADTSADASIHEEISCLRHTGMLLFEEHQEALRMADELDARLRDARNSTRRGPLHPHMSNATIDLREQAPDYYAPGLGINKLRMICLMGSFLGVVIELIWCVLKYGVLQSRSGLVWGPFNLLYGIGAVVLTVALYKYRNRGAWLSFLGGMAVGSVVEYLCSWLQESILGSVSWDYSTMPFNLNGRICLLYSILWGILGVLWIKNLYPRLARLLLKIPNRLGRFLSISLTVFLLINAVVSGIAVFRWSQRVRGIAPPGPLWSLIDRHFPDERMSRIYANMEFHLPERKDS